MDISLSPDNEKFLQNQIAAGIYKTISEAINALLNKAICDYGVQQVRVLELNKEIEIGMNAYRNGEYKDGDTAMEELSRRFA